MNLNSKKGLIARLRRGKAARQQFTESHVNKTIAHQIRAVRDSLGWSQERLAAEVGMNQNAVSRLESAEYGKSTITTLKRLAAAFDVCLVVRFAPFSEIVNWVSGTPHFSEGLTTESLVVPSFAREEDQQVFEQTISSLPTRFVELIRGSDSQNKPQNAQENVLQSIEKPEPQIYSGGVWNLSESSKQGRPPL